MKLKVRKLVERVDTLYLENDQQLTRPHRVAIAAINAPGQVVISGEAAAVNAIAEQFVSVANSLKNDRLTTVTGVLRLQLDRARAELAAAEETLERFKVNTITLPSQPRR